MASEVAHPEPVNNTLVNDAPLTNGNGDHTMTDTTANTEAFEENATISKSELSANTSADAPSATKPIENVTSGITAVADFIPKDAPTSHPTPPPDEPLVTSEANLDTEMTSAEQPVADSPAVQADLQPSTESAVQAAVTAPVIADAPVPVAASAIETGTDATGRPDEEPLIAPVSASSETSLVRPREEDDDGAEEEEGRAAKRTRVEGEIAESAPIEAKPESEPVNTTNGQSISAPVEAAPQATADAMDIRPTEAQPAAAEAVPATNGQPTAEVKTEATAVSSNPTEAEVKDADASTAPRSLASATTPKYSTKPLTPPQTRFLQEKMKNLKKTKNSAPFLNPVDPVALNIPTYPDIVKQPMDLNTMEQKLKAGRYSCVQDFADDFALIINNTRIFNGPNHAVTQIGMAMEAYFRKMMESVPSADQPAPARPQPKKASPKPPAPARRESRSAAHPPTNLSSANGSSSEPFALQPDGTPQIRRESTTNRPARAIKPPPARELAYAKPKRKEHQLELRFAEEVLNKIRSPRYANVNSVFLAPVDPVALNIPHYRQIVKQPMDLGTMTQKLKNGQYSRASEVKKDFDLMIDNCLAFNPNGNPVRDLGIGLRREFDQLWRSKENWEKKQRQARAASASDEESGDEEDEEEEEEETPQDAAGTIRALQKQLADMQNALAGLGQQPKPSKKAKAPKSSSKKASAAPLPKAKPVVTKAGKPKKPKMVTYEEKQEISEAVGKMDGPQVEQLTGIITSNCSKYAEQEEMELEIDDLPNHVQAMLLTFVRGIFGNPHKKARAVTPDDGAGADDDDFEPGERRGAKGGKRKKHKPMGKAEQQSAIDNIQKQLAQFQGGGASGSASPTTSGFAAKGRGAETSDDESEESEEE
ncbi:Putative bromodomain, NET domain, Bromodomain-like superfamily, NET domain superfamily protein [Septoria linicola]|uniref:Bromodomain, NET domain, Bromodomain-like superfamily, NET domain superfamily protein n=1 Tax=Septoria linicola TaxID=215465 RepID=A0A9Q9EEC0_9PEZI|nr:Putative bromodomain, NET domain, Bromodomain-like superfamily, NET domain superfamily protein [Septoria linicola]